ncbi:transmembrane protein 70, mitochondrial isoform X2 [Brachionichthys hirsutus]|uniref:transmembrane protein 70, mitochondrial isoform X2 n=1 Tax=Brachionichthys hirsutus TaxID=412623 RepID=UPI003604BE79
MITRLTLFSVHRLLRFRPFVVSLSVSNAHNAPARHSASFTGAVTEVRPPFDIRRSLLNVNYKSRRPSIRCLSVVHSGDGNLVYTGSMGRAVLGVKLLSYSSSVASLLLALHVLLHTDFGAHGFAVKVLFPAIAGFFTFLIPALLHLLTKGYVLRLYHEPDKDTYTAVTLSLFLTEKKTVFHQSQVRIPAVSKMFTTLYADRMGLLVNPDLFPIPQDYNHLMGYDKPFSFDTDSVNRPDK